jgi:hypothetical protein
MQQGGGAIELLLRGLTTGNREIDLAEFFGSVVAVLMLVRRLRPD